MCKQVLLPRDVKRELGETFKVDKMRLSRALKFEINSPSARMLRAAAYERGGLLYNDAGWSKGFSPKCDTHHDHATGTIRQEFGDGLEVRIGTKTHAATLLKDGELVAVFTDMTTEKWGRVVYGVQMIYNSLNS